MNNIETVQKLLETPLQERGYDLVMVKWLQGNPAVLQIMAERQSGMSLTLDDCVLLNNLVSTLLDVHDTVPHAYQLEVGSPGIDRPLVKKQDFQRFVGKEAFVEVALPENKTKRLTGILAGVHEEKILLRVDALEEVLELPYSGIRQAHLRLEKNLWSAGKKNRAATKRISRQQPENQKKKVSN